MVAEANTQEPQAAPDTEAEVSADSEVTEDAAEDQVKTESTEGETPDPAAAMAERLSVLEEQAKSAGALDPVQVNRTLGQIPALQSELARIRDADPSAALNPRFEALSEEIGDIADLLSTSELLSEEVRTALRQRRSERTTTRKIEALEVQIEAAKSSSTTPAEPEAPDQTQQLMAIQEIRGYARAKGVEITAIPADDLMFKPGETLRASTDRVLGVIDDLVTEDGATERVATRKAAAGSGSPNGTGGPTSDETLLAKLEEGGRASLSEAETKRAAVILGVKT